MGRILCKSVCKIFDSARTNTDIILQLRDQKQIANVASGDADPPESPVTEQFLRTPPRKKKKVQLQDGPEIPCTTGKKQETEETTA